MVEVDEGDLVALPEAPSFAPLDQTVRDAGTEAARELRVDALR